MRTVYKILSNINLEEVPANAKLAILKAMDRCDAQANLMELEAGTARAVTQAFAGEFVESTDYATYVVGRPEYYQHLFNALSNAVENVYNLAKGTGE